MVDQHAASEKSLFLQYMLNPTKKYTAEVEYKTQVGNFMRGVMEDNRRQMEEQGWKWQLGRKGAAQTEVVITQAPEVYGKPLQEEDFAFMLDRLYADREGEDTTSYSSYSHN